MINMDIANSKVTYSVMLIKRGGVDKNFDKLVDTFLNRLKKANMINGDIHTIKEKCTRVAPNVIIFEYGYPYFSWSDEQRKSISSAKKEIQSIIKENNLQDNMMVFGKYQYVMQSDKPIDVQETIFELNQHIQHLQVNIYDLKMRKFMVEAMNKKAEISWEVLLEWTYSFETLDNNFYRNIKNLSDYLFKNKLLDAQLDINDIQRRYSDGLEEAEAKVATSGDKRKMIKRYVFGLLMKRVKPDEFMKIQEKFFKMLKLPDYTNTPNITFTTNADGLPIGYGCYVVLKPKNVK